MFNWNSRNHPDFAKASLLPIGRFKVLRDDPDIGETRHVIGVPTQRGTMLLMEMIDDPAPAASPRLMPTLKPGPGRWPAAGRGITP